MSKGIKFKDNIYLDSSGIMHNRQALKNILNSLIPVVLYNNSSGSNGTITLSETSANFSYIEIFYRNNDNQYNSIKVYQPNGKNVSLISMFVNNELNYVLKSARATISNNTISIVGFGETYFQSGIINWSNNTYITRVVGYK